MNGFKMRKSLQSILVVLVASLCVVTRADRTISANLTLTEDADWRSDGKVTIEEGVTVNLNGHTLKLSDLAGSGTIDNAMVDLTENDPARVSSPTTFSGSNPPTSAANAFNNNFARNSGDNTRRILVDLSNQALIIDYDFGETGKQVVNAYKLYCGPFKPDQVTGRCPKSWTLEASNNTADWTVLDSRQDQPAWSSVFNNSECRLMTFENETPYRYYRFKATAAQTGSIIEIVQLEYLNTNASELWLDVPEGATVVNSGVAIKGNIKFVKDGAGTFVPAKYNQTYEGGNVVKGGILRLNNPATVDNSSYSMSNPNALNPLGVLNARPIVVMTNAVYDIFGVYDSYFVPVELAGGTLRNTKTMTCWDWGAIDNVTVTAPGSLLDVPENTVFNGSNIDLGGYELTVKLYPDRYLYMKGGMANGTFNIIQVGWLVFNGSFSAPTVDFKVNGATSMNTDITVRDWAMVYDGTSRNGSGKIKINGVFTPSTNNHINHFELQDGATLNLAGRSDLYNTTSAKTGQTLGFAANANVSVDYGDRSLTLGDRVVAWNVDTRPKNVTFTRKDAVSGEEPLLVSVAGLFYGADPASTLAESATLKVSGVVENFNNPAIWSCINLANVEIPNGLPGADTVVRFSGSLNVQIPAGAVLPFRVAEFGNCQLTADCDLRGIAKFALKDNARVELNQHKLWVNGLYGKGEIGNTGSFDLTTPSGLVASPTTFYATNVKASNLFNNVNDDDGSNGRRIILTTQNLPCIVDYDFGAETYVDVYALYVGHLALSRAPKRWRIYGSNEAAGFGVNDDNAHWTLLDSRRSEAVKDDGKIHRRSFAVGKPGTYRYYRFWSDAACDAAIFEMAGLEYGDSRTFGELHVSVPRGETCQNTSVSLTGLMKLFKEGEGTFVPAKYNQTYLGGTVVEGGVLRLNNPATVVDDATYGMRSTNALNPLGGALASSPSASEVMPIVVKTNAVYDIFGVYDSNLVPVELAGGTLRNTKTMTKWNSGAVDNVAVTAPGSILDIPEHTVFNGSNFDLGGYELTVKLYPDRYLHMIGGMTNGTFSIVQVGWLEFDGAFDASTVDFKVNGAVNMKADIAVRNWAMVYDGASKDGTGKVKISGVFTPSANNYINNFELQDGATLNLSGRSGSYNVASSKTGQTLAFADADDMTVFIDLMGRKVKSGSYVVTWATPPANLSKVTFKLKGNQCGWLTVDEERGVKFNTGLVIIIR